MCVHKTIIDGRDCVNMCVIDGQQNLRKQHDQASFIQTSIELNIALWEKQKYVYAIQLRREISNRIR